MRTYFLILLGLTACGSDSSGSGGELCGNGRDDDGDGFSDCADQDCWSALSCADGATTNPDVGADSATPDDVTSVTTSTLPDSSLVTDITDASLPDTGPSCEPCGLGQIKGRVCAPSEQVFINDADIVVSGIGCDGQPFTIETESGHDGSYWVLDVPCGTHEITITKGSYSAIYAIPVVSGEITDVTGAANKLCFEATRTRIAALDGTWDDLAGLVMQLGFDVDLYTEDAEPGSAGTIVQLLADTELLFSYDIVLANCGAENGWMPQEHPELMQSVKEFVLRGGSLYMSDYAWVYGEWAFPTAVEWLNDDDPAGMGKTATSPQQIDSGIQTRATIVDGALATLLGKTELDIVFDQGPQIAPESVGPGTFAHVVGDISVPLEFSIDNAPLALSYRPAANAGRVIYTNFHNDAQATTDMLTILNYLVFTL